MRKIGRTPLIIGVIGLLLIIGGASIAYGSGLFRSNDTTTSNGTIIDSDKPSADFTLTSADGPVRLSDFAGKTVAIYFGYTYCPDVCPTALASLAQARKNLGDEADNLQVIMVSVDPERDTPDRLKTYVTTFDPSFIGVTGTPEEIQAVATAYGVYYEKQPVEGAAGYLVDHTAAILVLDGDRYLKRMLPYNLTGQQLAQELRAVEDS